jgi:phosphoribosyl-ATP pyrophosphohydrolase
MNKREILEKMVSQHGSCHGIRCREDNCPFYDERCTFYCARIGADRSTSDTLSQMMSERGNHIPISETEPYLSQMMECDQDIYKKTLEHFGAEKQRQKFCEEAAEAIVVIHHWRDKKATQEDVASEIADVIIMAQQVKWMLSPGLVDIQVQYKLNRLKDRIAK